MHSQYDWGNTLIGYVMKKGIVGFFFPHSDNVTLMLKGGVM